jgi:hypothetical protein
MTHFLIVYRRTSGSVLEMRQYDEPARTAAMQARSEKELTYRSDGDVEVVLLTAESREALERTHSRYFRTGKQLLFDQLTEWTFLAGHPTTPPPCLPRLPLPPPKKDRDTLVFAWTQSLARKRASPDVTSRTACECHALKCVGAAA